MENIKGKPLNFETKQLIAFIHLLLVEDIARLAPCGSLQDMGLQDPVIHVALPPLDADLTSADHTEALALL